MLYRFVALGVALACGIWTGLAVQENYDEICDEVRKSIADTDMPRADREKIAEAVVQFLPAGLPFAAFLVTYMAMALLGYLISCVCSCCGCCGGCCGCGPGHEYAMMPPTVAIGGQYRVMLVPPPTAPRGTWSDGLCSCLSDAPVALVACCVPPLLPAMLYERVTGHAGSCKLLTVFVGGLWLLATFGAPAFCQYGGSLPSHVPNECRLVNAASTASMVCMVLLVWTVRSRVRQAFHIPPSCACDACDDGVCACFCLPLTAAQVTRHLNATEGTRFSLSSPTGAAARHFPPAAGYAPQPAYAPPMAVAAPVPGAAPHQAVPAGSEVPMGLPVTPPK